MPFKKMLIAGLLFWLLGCGASAPVQEEKAPLGSGSSSPATSSSLVTQLITRTNGENLGIFSYDTQYFTPIYLADSSTDAAFVVLVNVDFSLQVTLSRALGRPDTLCRYLPAVLARDQKFEIGKAGFKTNDLGQDLYHTSASLASDYRSFYCGELAPGSGVLITALANDPIPLESGPFFSLLNSIEAFK